MNIFKRQLLGPIHLLYVRHISINILIEVLQQEPEMEYFLEGFGNLVTLVNKLMVKKKLELFMYSSYFE